jgi:hypothetical protein
LGTDSYEAEFIIKNLVLQENEKVNIFVDENPKILLPTNLDISIDDNEHDASMAEQGEGDVAEQGEGHVPQDSLKEPLNTQKWSEVVRKGKSKSKSRIPNKCDYEGCILEFEGA